MSEETKITKKTLVSLGFIVPLIVSLVIGAMSIAVSSFQVTANAQDIKELRDDVQKNYVRKESWEYVVESLRKIEKKLGVYEPNS